MTYFAFLAIFLGIPMTILSLITIVDYRRGKWQPNDLLAWRPWVVILGLCVVAFIYTTPWDNYLVATRVWYYNPELVTGIIIGYVPIEEYTFFILLPIFTGLWTLILMRYLPLPAPIVEAKLGVRMRIGATLVTFVFWVICCVLLVLTLTTTEWDRWTYFALLTSWGLIPIMIQLAFGADILWRHIRVVTLAIASSTLYLCLADVIAINAGTWTIDPPQSLPVFIGTLPIEEFLFFLTVNVLVVMGLTLVLAKESQQRAIALEKYAVFRPLANALKKQINPTVLAE